MQAILLAAHGSRRAASNDEVRALTTHIAELLGESVPLVDAAFLELAKPSIAEGLESLIQRGATEIQIFPYFLAAGRHVVQDIPAEMAPIIAKYPQVTLRVATHLGANAALPQLIASALQSAP